MRVVILCGGRGTRILEETKRIPKPMVRIGTEPIICHIMNIYNKFGFKDFILAAGYKKEILKKYFKSKKKYGNVTVIDTGQETMTGGRILRLKPYLKKEENFLCTYGDGVSNINLKKLINFHNKYKKIATITAVRPTVRFGELKIKNNFVQEYKEKPQAKAGWINGGFFVLNKAIFDYIQNDKTVFEKYPLEKLSKKKQLVSFLHRGFWQCMDTMREKILLNELWKKNNAPWK